MSFKVLIFCVLVGLACVQEHSSLTIVLEGGGDEICCQHQLNECDFSCLNKTDKIWECEDRDKCLGTAVQCSNQTGRPSIRGDRFCKCNVSYAQKERDVCERRTVLRNSFTASKLNQVVLSNEVCRGSGIPRASIQCKFDPGCGAGKARLMESTLYEFDCNDVISSIIDNILGGSGSGLDVNTAVSAVLEQLNASHLKFNNTQKLADFLSYISQRSENETLVVTTQLFSNLAAIATYLTPVNKTRKSNSSSSQKVVTVMASLAQRVDLTNSTGRTFELSTATMIIKLTDNSNLNESVSFSPGAGNAKVVIPASVLRKALRGHKSGRSARSLERVRSAFIFYRDGNLFYSNGDVPWVVSVDVGVDQKFENLSDPVRIQSSDVLSFGKTPLSNSTLQSLKTTSRCVYWDENFEKWSSDGCCMNITADPPECLCNHLTNFAALVRTEVVSSDVVLSLVSDVGCILSMVGLFLTIIVHLADRDIRQRRPVKIMVHLCSNLLISYLIFVVAIGRTESRYGCVLATALLHYFLLTSFCWTSVYSFDMYKSLVKVFSDRRRYYIQHCVTFAYGLPMLIVIGTVGLAIGYFDQLEKPKLCDGLSVGIGLGTSLVDRRYNDILSLEKSHYSANNMCWLHGYSLYFGFLLPLGILLLYNCYVFGNVTNELSCKTNEARTPELRRSVKQKLLIAFTMVSILGLCWTTAYLLLLSQQVLYTTILSWVFALLCTLQGFAIFLLTSVRRSDIRDVWLEPLRSMARRTSISATSFFRSPPRKQSSSSGQEGETKAFRTSN